MMDLMQHKWSGILRDKSHRAMEQAVQMSFLLVCITHSTFLKANVSNAETSNLKWRI